MTNDTKALEVASHMHEGEALYQLLHLRKNADESGVFEVDDVTFQIVAAALSDYATQLAERDAQLVDERAMADRLAATLYFVSAHVVHERVRKFDTLETYHAHKVARQPTQDKGE